MLDALVYLHELIAEDCYVVYWMTGLWTTAFWTAWVLR